MHNIPAMLGDAEAIYRKLNSGDAQEQQYALKQVNDFFKMYWWIKAPPVAIWKDQDPPASWTRIQTEKQLHVIGTDITGIMESLGRELVLKLLRRLIDEPTKFDGLSTPSLTTEFVDETSQNVVMQIFAHQTGTPWE